MIKPRASLRQWGAKRPEKAGTKKTPPLSGTCRLRDSISDDSAIRPKLSRNHCTREPAMAMEPSRAIHGRLVAQAVSHVFSSPLEDCTGRWPVLSSRKQPVP
jgi:hypothetical protein